MDKECIPMGWQCPKCERIYAPSHISCGWCNMGIGWSSEFDPIGGVKMNEDELEKAIEKGDNEKS